MFSLLVSYTIEFVQIALLLYLTFRMIKDKMVQRSLTAVFYVFGNVSYLIADVYWIVHMLLKEGDTPKFSAVEIGVVGVLLLYGMALQSYGENRPARGLISPTIVLAIGFTFANTACWIGWNGGWFRDIITGIAMGYLAYVIASFVEKYDLFDLKKYMLALAGCLILMALEAGTLVFRESHLMILEIFRYILWFGGVLYFMYGIYFHVIKNNHVSLGLFYSFGGYVFSVFAMYLSADIMYQITDGITTFMMIPIYMSVRREAVQA